MAKRKVYYSLTIKDRGVNGRETVFYNTWSTLAAVLKEIAKQIAEHPRKPFHPAIRTITMTRLTAREVKQLGEVVLREGEMEK